jgi:3-oxoacyl-[acyl-carrier-protein] synthase III
MQALFGDGAGAVVVEADPVSVEQADFELVLASQSKIHPRASTNAAVGWLREDGLLFHPPGRSQGWYVRENIHQCVADALAPLGIS